MARRLSSVMHYAHGSPLIGRRAVHRELPRKARWHQLLLRMLMVGITCAPVCTRAADSSVLRSRQPAGVVMVIGGMTDGDDSAPLSQTREPVVQVKGVAPSDDGGHLSMIMEPGRSPSDLSIASSSSTASRVTALAPMVDEIGRTAGVDSALLMAVIDVESGGNALAVSRKGATGLMQLMPDTGARQGALDLFNPRQNVEAGARYLRQLMQQFGDLRLALAAYNAGEGAVQKYGGQIPPYAETMNYVPRVMARYLHYRNVTGLPNGAISNSGTDASQGRFLLVRQNGRAEE
ncbi:Transglycosylase SLT domain-containing protein [Paraburkholderia phenazinium]|uniref:Transglycosylase SLT domain-containing protein n=2 Tax=Paraburkholderia phenazinium TaxID=60549 RepID=A0A1N6JKU7_9BURK|nr:Transglycosylase SLT domain-containing protein [Paraburkholderia phenazinium]